MDIQVEIPNIKQVVDALRNIPNGARFALHHAIKDSLDTARTTLTRAIRDRYNVPYSWVLNAIGKPSVQGLTGFLHITGSKVPLYLFPHRDIFPYGVAIEEVKGEPPINLMHAFTPGNKGTRGSSSLKIYQREGESAPSYPIRWIMGLSVPEMADETKHVQSKVQLAMEQEYYRSINNLIKQYTAGNLIPGWRNKRP
jgi:hypothetical protein